MTMRGLDNPRDGAAAGATAHELREQFQHHIEVGAPVLMDFGGATGRMKGFIRGWTPGSRLILEKAQGADGAPEKGEACHVRLLVGGDAWGFTSAVTHPAPDKAGCLMYLSWPAVIKRIRVRRHVRAPVAAPCAIHNREGQKIEGMVMDLSASGARVRSPHRMRRDDAVEVSFKTADCTVERLGALVRNVTANSRGVVEVGLEFTDLAAARNSGVGLYVTRVMARRAGLDENRPYVLLVTPNIEDEAMVAEQLKSRDWKPVVAGNLLELGYHVHIAPPVAVLMSAQWDKCGAADLCRLVKEAPGFSTLPVVAYGEAAMVMEEAILEAGAEACVLDAREGLARITGGATPRPASGASL